MVVHHPRAITSQHPPEQHLPAVYGNARRLEPYPTRLFNRQRPPVRVHWTGKVDRRQALVDISPLAQYAPRECHYGSDHYINKKFLTRWRRRSGHDILATQRRCNGNRKEATGI